MLVDHLGAFAATACYDELSVQDVDAAKLRVLDLLGAALAGVTLGNGRLLLPLVQCAGPSSVWGTHIRASMRDAALVNSFLAHSTYLEDGSRFTGGHPSSVVIPSALAVADAHPCTGRQLIGAIVIGYEVFLRLGRAIYPRVVMKGFQSTSVLGSVAAAATVVNLLRMPSPHSAHALAIACTLGVGLKAALHSSGSQPLQVARSCEGGIVAALFAAAGAHGYDAIIEEGYFNAFGDGAGTCALEDLGRRFSIGETYLKIHGGCRGNHAPIDAVQRIQSEHRFEADEVRSISIEVDSVTHSADIATPASGKDAQFSIRFGIASALLNGDASIFRFTDDAAAAPRMRALMSRIDVRPNKAFDKTYPKQRGARADLVLADGRQMTAFVENARGEPECPVTADEIARKFELLATPRLGTKTRRVMGLVMDLEALPDVRVLTSCFDPGARSCQPPSESL